VELCTELFYGGVDNKTWMENTCNFLWWHSSNCPHYNSNLPTH